MCESKSGRSGHRLKISGRGSGRATPSHAALQRAYRGLRRTCPIRRAGSSLAYCLARPLTSGKSAQNEIGSRFDFELWQNDQIISEPVESLDQPMILGDTVLQVLLAFTVPLVDFWPRWSQKHLVMEAGVSRQADGGRQSGCMFQRDGGTQQPAIEEHPTLRRRDAVAVSGRHVDGVSCEAFEIDPGEMPRLRRSAPATRTSCQAPGEFRSLVKQVRAATSTSRPSRAAGKDHVLAAMAVFIGCLAMLSAAPHAPMCSAFGGAANIRATSVS